MLKAIDRKAQELEQEDKDKPRKMREEAIQSIENFLEEEERQSPEIQKLLEQFAKKVENTPVNDLSSVVDKANNFVLEKRYKRKRLY